MSAMQEMLLNMILPKEEQEQLKKALTPENIKAFINTVTNGYKSLTYQLNRIEGNQQIIMKHLGLEPIPNDCDSDRTGAGTADVGGSGDVKRIAS